MSVEMMNPDTELVHGPGDREDDVEFKSDEEGKFHFSEAIEMCNSFAELCSVLRDNDDIKTIEGSPVSGDDAARVVEQIAAAANEDVSVNNDEEIHGLILSLPKVLGLDDKVMELLNSEE